MKRIWALVAVAVGILASAITYGLVAKTGEGQLTPQISQTDVDPECLARAMDLQIYAFELPIPKEECTLNVWLERWTHDSQTPQIFGLFTISGLQGEGLGKLTICLPTTNHPQSLVMWSTHGGKTVALGPNVTSTPLKSSLIGGTTISQLIDMKEITGSTFIDPQAMVFDQDIPLMTLQYNKSGIVHGRTKPFERENESDVTWYLQARFSPGKSYHGIVTWKDGKIAIQ